MSGRAKEYMALVDGKLVSIADLTLEQVQEAICDAYDFIEDLDVSLKTIRDRIEEWR
jgi:hypothetical protein